MTADTTDQQQREIVRLCQDPRWDSYAVIPQPDDTRTVYCCKRTTIDRVYAIYRNGTVRWDPPTDEDVAALERLKRSDEEER